MPTYEYACKSCQEHVEVVQSFRDAPLTTCAVCGGPLRKVFSPIGIAFKGSGFYRTDSRAAASKRPAGKASGSGEGGSSSKDAGASKDTGSSKSGDSTGSGGSSGGKADAAAS